MNIHLGKPPLIFKKKLICLHSSTLVYIRLYLPSDSSTLIYIRLHLSSDSCTLVKTRLVTHLCFYLVVQNFKTQFSWKKKSKKCTSFEEQKDVSYIRENVYFDITISRCLLSTKLYLEFLFICFAWEKKGVDKIL